MALKEEKIEEKPAPPKVWLYHHTEEAVCVSPESAQSYMDRGFTDSPATAVKTEMTAEERVAKIDSVVAEIVAEDDASLCTAKGVPLDKEVEKRCGFSVTSAERLASFEILV